VVRPQYLPLEIHSGLLGSKVVPASILVFHDLYLV
jgi:hypothetical protein